MPDKSSVENAKNCTRKLQIGVFCRNKFRKQTRLSGDCLKNILIFVQYVSEELSELIIKLTPNYFDTLIFLFFTKRIFIFFDSRKSD